MSKLTKKQNVFEEDTSVALNENLSENEKLVKYNEKQAIKISVISMTGNILLSLFKLLAGIVGLSYAMVADAIHSLSDVFTTIIVIVGVKISARKADRGHPYGHDRFECIAALILSFILFDVGLVVGYSAISKLISKEYLTASLPKTIALVAAIVSIAEQFVMFVLTRIVAKKINSGALKADAWHHLSDSLSSIGSFVGILGAMLGFPILDIIAGIVICLIILKVAVDIFIDAVKKLTDCSVDETTITKIKDLASSTDGVKNIDRVQTRQFGNMIYVDLEIACDKSLSLLEAHTIADKVHDRIESELKTVKHCQIHVNPYEGNIAENSTKTSSAEKLDNKQTDESANLELNEKF